MRTRIEIPPKGSRTCANRDCWKLARPNGWFCSDACRARTWKDRHPEYIPPPGQHARQNAAERLTRVSNGGLQVSYRKAVQAMASVLRRVYERTPGRTDHIPDEFYVRWAEDELRRVLPVKQRARLEGRS